MKKNLKKYPEPTFVVLGNYGITYTNKHKENLLGEVKRLKKLEFNGNIIPCVITYKLSLTKNKHESRR